MSSTEVYSLSADFGGTLYNDMFQDTINEVIMTKTCDVINTINDQVDIVFNEVLDVDEKTQLDNLVSNYVPSTPIYTNVADFFKFDDIYQVFETYELNNFNVVKNQWNYPTNWNKLNGSMDNFDKTTGIFNSKTTCIYLYNISVRADTANANTDLKITLQNNLNQPIFGTDQRLNQNGECWAFVGTGGILTPNDQIKFALNVDTNDFVCDLVCKFLLLFCA